MKYVLVVGLIVVVVISLFYAFSINNEPDQAALESIDIVSQFEVTPLSADVSVSSTADDWDVITELKRVLSGNTVRTSADGRAIIANDSEIISSLDNNSEIKVNRSSDSKKSNIALLRGRIWSKVSRALEQDEAFEVYTPTMAAAVRGTSFGVSLDSSRSLIVTEGIVFVQRRNPDTGELVANSGIEVSAGNTLEDNGVTFTIRKTTPQDKDTWYENNNSQVETNKIRTLLKTQSNPTTTTTSSAPSSTTTTTTTPTVTNEPPVISSVSPNNFDSRTTSDFRISGSNITSATQVLLNGDPVEFIVTTTELLVVKTTELRDGYDIYDVTVTTPYGSNTMSNAFENKFQGINLTIDEALFLINQSSQSYIMIRGSGMSEVDTVLVEGQVLPFTLVNSTELNVNYDFLEFPTPIEVRAGTQTASGSVSP